MLAFTRGDQLADISPDSTPGFAGDQKDGEEALADCTKRLGQLQERLFAESKGGGRRSVLLVIQGMDTSGKGGILDHVVGAVGPQRRHGLSGAGCAGRSAWRRRRRPPAVRRTRSCLLYTSRCV